MIIINNFDVSEYPVSQIPFNFRFPDYPGQITYSPITSIELYYPRDESLSPFYPTSPLYGILENKQLKIQMSETNYYTQSIEGFITNANINSGKINLTIEDRIQKILNKKMVLVNYTNKTPIELAILILESYGIEINPANTADLDYAQRYNGLIFDLSLTTETDITVNEIIDQLSQAGFMRLCIFENKMYCCGSNTITQLDIMSSELCSIPSQSTQSIQFFNGGEIKWVAGIISEPYYQSSNESPLILDYSSTSILKLNNPSGAYYILDQHSKRDAIGPYFEINIINDIANLFRPGVCYKLKKPCLNSIQDFKGRLVCKEIISQFQSKCIFEIIMEN